MLNNVSVFSRLDFMCTPGTRPIVILLFNAL